jgi:hypothetical protein
LLRRLCPGGRGEEEAGKDQNARRVHGFTE